MLDNLGERDMRKQHSMSHCAKCDTQSAHAAR
jgi:hypothetical protein